MATLKGQITSDVEVVASFNGSMRGYRIPEWCRIVEQQTNIGGRVQWMLGPLITKGDYLWMLGDDDRVMPGGVSEVLSCLADDPGMVLMHDGEYDLGVPMGSRFDSYGDLITAQRDNGRAAAITAHTLCAATVFARDSFDLQEAVLRCDSMYGQHYAMLTNLFQEHVRVVSKPTFWAGSSMEASIWSHSTEMQAEHVNAYPLNIYRLIEWISECSGVALNPVECWVPGDGFDSPWRPNVHL